MNENGTTTAGQKALKGARLVEQGMGVKQAAAMVGTNERNVIDIRTVLRKAPHVVSGLEAGEISLYAATVAAGIRTQPVRVKNFGTRSDAWKETMAPLLKYLRSWKAREFRYTHVSPAEAARRLRLIAEVEELFVGMKYDLEQRSHKATSKVPTR